MTWLKKLTSEIEYRAAVDLIHKPRYILIKRRQQP